jgi:hypothetical protein
MENEKKLYRRWWFDDWQAAQAEEWLTDLAEQGWQLEYIGNWFAKFKSSEEALLSYFCVSHRFMSDEDDKNAKDLYAKAGWSYVDNYEEKLHVFCAPKDTKPPDAAAKSPAGQLRLEKRHYRNEAISSAFIIVFLPLFFLLVGGISWLQDAFQLKDFGLIISIILYPAVPFLLAWDIVKILRLKRRISEGAEQECGGGESGYRKTIAWRRAIRILEIAIFVLPIVSRAF